MKDLSELHLLHGDDLKRILAALLEKAALDKSYEKLIGVKLLCLANIVPQLIKWLWKGRFALGKLSILVGDPGLGKSFLTLYLAARVSLGEAWPDGTPCPKGSVIIVSCEDDVADTISPRLKAAGADVSKIHQLTAVIHYNQKGEPVEGGFLLENVAALEEAVINIGDVVLVTIDPLSAYMGKSDSHNNAEVRGVLAPLSELAAKYGFAVIGVSHLNKAQHLDMVYRTMGSLAFTAAARAVWVVVKDKDAPDRRLVLPIKNNIGIDDSGLAYRLKQVGDTAIVEWEVDPVTININELLSNVPAGKGGGVERNEAVEFLKGLLSEKPLEVKVIKKQATEAGFSWKTVKRAKDLAYIKGRKEGFGADGYWVWAWPTPKST